MNSRYKDKLVGVYAPGNYGHTSVLDQTQEFSRWFWSNRILTLEQLPDEELLRKMVELCNG